MSALSNLQPFDGKRRRPQKSERHDARKFIEPIRRQIRAAFTNTSDSEHVARHFEATLRSTLDVVVSGHDAVIEDQGQRLEAIERKLGMGRADTAAGRLLVMRRAS